MQFLAVPCSERARERELYCDSIVTRLLSLYCHSIVTLLSLCCAVLGDTRGV
jgi:hypothetical protein